MQASARLRAQQLPGPKAYYVTSEQPDFWFEASEVWEIRGADLTISPVHKVRYFSAISSSPGIQNRGLLPLLLISLPPNMTFEAEVLGDPLRKPDRAP